MKGRPKLASYAWRPLSATLLFPSCVWILAATAADPPQAAPIFGTVVDESGGGISGARVHVSDALGTVLYRTVTGENGDFALSGLTLGSYAVEVDARGFEKRAVRLAVPLHPEPLVIRLAIGRVRSELTVTAQRGVVSDAAASPQLVTVLHREDLSGKAIQTVGNAVEGTAGTMVQQTTSGQVSPHLRGLTGYQTLFLVDGIRFNTSIFRSGPNQYLAFVEPNQVEAIEVVLGPTGANYGSDSLGGTVQLLTRQASVASGPRLVQGDAGLMLASSDLSASPAGQVSIGTSRVNWLLGGSKYLRNDMRAGKGFDSHNVYRRYFGLSPTQIRDLLGDRLQDTAFGQFGAHTKLAIRSSAGQSLTFWYQRGDMTGVRSYRDQLGGLGRLQASFDPQTLNFFYARYEKLRLGILDSLSGTFSINSQRDDTVRQGLRMTDVITRDRNRVDVFGYAVQGAAHVSSRMLAVFGGEIYREHISSQRLDEDPVRRQSVKTRALYTHGSRYTTYGLFSQNTIQLVRDRLRANMGTRWTGVTLGTFAAKNRDQAGRDLGVTDSAQNFRDLTFHSSLTWDWTRHFGIHALVSRGFRAPNMNDLGAIGLTGLGFEVPAEYAIPYASMLSRDASEGALSSGVPVKKLRPETLLNYEVGVRAHTDKLYLRAQLFDSELIDPIVRRTLLFPAGKVPASMGGVPVTVLSASPAQIAQGVVTVATSLDPRAVKSFVNDGQSRYYGVETLVRYTISARWSAEGNYTYLVGRDLFPNRPARRLPPQQAHASVRYVPSGRRLWLEFGGTLVGPQTRFSASDLDDERIGASRRRSDIASFFGSAVVSSYVNGGIFVPTGENLRQIQDRVLPLGSTINGVTIANDNSRVPLYSLTSGWFTADVRGGFQLGENWSLGFGVLNLEDRNYRIHGSGIDSPGVRGFLGLRWLF